MRFASAAVRLIGATVAGLAVLAGSTGPATALPAVRAAGSTVDSALPAAPGTAAGVDLRLTKVTPAAVGPDDELVVSGTARNLGGTPVKNMRLSLWLRPEVLADREAIDSWTSEGSLTAADRRLPAAALVRTLNPGATARFTLTVPAGEAGLFSWSDFGPRAIGVQARAGGKRLATLNSTIVWAPTEITTRTRLSVVVPITSSTPSTHTGEPTAAAAADLLPGGRLRDVLTAADERAIAWAVDPAILASAQRLVADGVDRSPADAALASPETNDPTGSTAPTTSAAATAAAQPQISDETAATGAQDWLTLFGSGVRVRGGGGVLGLPYADPDLTAVLKNRQGAPLLRSSDALGRAATLKALGGPIDTTVALPADGRINAATTRGLAREGRTAVILASAAQPPDPEIDYTPSGAGTVRSGGQTLKSLLYDEQLSSLISSSAAQSPASTQTLLAQLAAITMERPGTARHVLAVTPRTWNPDPASFQALMDAVGSAPWVSLRGLSELRAADGPDRRAPRYGTRAADAEVPPGVVSSTLVLDRGLSTFQPILTDPAPVQPLRERVASLLSVSWRQDRDQLNRARITVATDVNKLVDGVKVVNPGRSFYTAPNGEFPITVLNTTDYEVEVVLRLRPSSGQLAFKELKSFKVEPNSKPRILTPATSVANGNVVVEAKLLTPGGTALGPGETFLVKVRPQWESWGMIGAGSVLGFLLVIGLLRGIRRNRRRPPVPIEGVPDVDELALEAEAEAGSGAGVTTGSGVAAGSGVAGDESDGDGGALTGGVAPGGAVPVGAVPGGEVPGGAVSGGPSGVAARHAAAQPAPAAPVPAGSPTPVGTSSMTESALAPGALAPGALAPGALRPGSIAVLASGPTPLVDPEPMPDPVPAVPLVPLPLPDPEPDHPDADAEGGPDRQPDPDAVTSRRARRGRRGPTTGGVAGTGGVGGGGGANSAPLSTTRMMRSSALMAGGTAVSRVLGFVRAALLVAVLDVGDSADAFTVANTVPNALYILLAGGVLNAVLVPQITRAAKRADGGQEYIDRLLTATVAILFVVTVAVTLAAPLLIQVYASDKWSPQMFTLAAAFAMWCLPQVFWYGIYTILGQVLNARGSFGPFMWAPVVNNVVGIAGLVVFAALAGLGDKSIESWTPGRIALLAGTATLGVVAQALILVPAMRRAGIGFHIRWGLRGFGLRTASRVAGWTFAAILVQQLGYIVITKVSTAGQKLSQSAGETLGTGLAVYAQSFLLFMLPHSLVAVSLVTALFTRMSISAAADRVDEVRADLSLGLRLTGLATVLSTAAFLALGPDITATLFAGNPKRTTDGIAYVAMAMIIGLVPFSAQYLFQRVFYAFEDAKTPFLVQVPIVVVWALGNVISLLTLPPQLIVVGVGFSMSVANTVGAALSFYLLHRRFGRLDGRRVVGTHLKMIVAAACGGVVAFAISRGVHGLLGQGRVSSMTAALLGAVALIGIYGLLLRRLKVTELEDALLPLLRRR